MRLEWDAAKRESNRIKHGLDFADAQAVFLGSTLTVRDQRRGYGEERFITLGLLQHRVVVVAHTQRGAATRIISMRKANEREQRRYQAYFAKP